MEQIDGVHPEKEENFKLFSDQILQPAFHAPRKRLMYFADS